jgi:hypothetical protein
MEEHRTVVWLAAAARPLPLTALRPPSACLLEAPGGGSTASRTAGPRSPAALRIRMGGGAGEQPPALRPWAALTTRSCTTPPPGAWCCLAATPPRPGAAALTTPGCTTWPTVPRASMAWLMQDQLQWADGGGPTRPCLAAVRRLGAAWRKQRVGAREFANLVLLAFPSQVQPGMDGVRMDAVESSPAVVLCALLWIKQQLGGGRRWSRPPTWSSRLSVEQPGTSVVAMGRSQDRLKLALMYASHGY